MKKKVLWGPNNIQIQLDQSEVFEDNPGRGTPAIVILHKGRETYTATYWCAVGEGEVEGYNLTPNQLNWLNEQEDEIEKFLKIS
jgi:hypothetical protein